MLAEIDFPPVSHLIEWPDIWFKGEWYAINKIALLVIASALMTLLLFFVAGRKRKLVPTGIQNVAEASVDFVREGIVMQTMGNSGIAWMPYLTSLFFFVLFCNLFEVIPGIQMPASARMAVPLLLAVLTWILFNASGVKNQGFFGYLKNTLFPPGVPLIIKPLVALIELISTFLVRPFSLAVRLFANLLAGHILLVTFAVLTTALIEGTAVLKPVAALPFIMLVLLTGFELLVAFLQAYIFTILTAVYVGGAQHPEH